MGSLRCETAQELVGRYEAAWEDIASRNRQICDKVGLHASVRAASDLCERAATDWSSLRSELQQLKLMQMRVRTQVQSGVDKTSKQNRRNS